MRNGISVYKLATFGQISADLPCYAIEMDTSSHELRIHLKLKETILVKLLAQSLSIVKYSNYGGITKPDQVAYNENYILFLFKSTF